MSIHHSADFAAGRDVDLRVVAESAKYAGLAGHAAAILRKVANDKRVPMEMSLMAMEWLDRFEAVVGDDNDEEGDRS